MRGQLLPELVRPPANVASVYIGLDHQDLHLRWRRLAGRLIAKGAPPGAIEAVERLVAQTPSGSGQLVAFSNEEGLLWHRTIFQGVSADRAEFGTPPLVVPLLAWLSRHPAYVEVEIDRQGGEVTAVAAGAAAGRTTTVIGPDEEITRGGPRGWDHARIERRAASSWRHNAGAVAAAASAALKKVDAELLLVAGQPRMVKLMLEQLSPVKGLTVGHLPGGRTRDGSKSAREAAVRQCVARYAARPVEPPGPRWVSTVADTLRALASGQVRTLLVVDDPADDRIAWFGPDQLCADAPGEGLIAGRLVDVAVRAAVLTDAEVRVVERDSLGAASLGAEGMRALCRFG